MRAFSARSIGPGSYAPDKENKYSFINHVGDIRMEANVEYRFRIIGDLHGAVFLDAGNVWLMRKDESRPGGEFTLKNFARQIALGTGAGLRYDMDFLVFRLDCGVGLHDPYDTGKWDTIIFPSSRTVLPCISLSVIRSKANCGFGADNSEELWLISKLKVEVFAIEAEFCTIMEKNGLKSSFF